VHLFLCTVARSPSPQACQAPQASQQAPTRPSVAGSSVSPVASSSACRPPSVPRPRVQLPQVDQPSLSLSHISRPSSVSLQVSQPAPLVPSNLFRGTPMPVGHLPSPRGSYGVQGELAPRAPAPHLQFRPPRTHSMPRGNQQQLPRLEATSSRTQLSPVAQETSSPSSSQPTLLANPPTPDSHQAPLVTSVISNLHLALPATSSPSGLRPVVPTSSVAPGSSPSRLANVPPTPNPGLLATAQPVINTVPCTTAAAWSGRCVGPSIAAGVQATDAGSLSLDAWLIPSVGLSSDSPRVGAPVNGVIDVVCLSDDDSN
jgi:hypothetical protein